MNPDKTARASNVPTPTSATPAGGQATHEQTARRAEQLWHQRGQPHGQDQSIWLEAESQLKAEAESRPVAGTESRPYVDEPAQPLRPGTKVQDPADSHVQLRSATEGKAKSKGPKVR